MKISAPIAKLGHDYRKLSVAEGRGKWRMISLLDWHYRLDEDAIPPRQVRSFHDKDGVVRLIVRPRLITMPSCYAWNGNSPKFGVRFLWRDWWFGTPDFFPQTVKSSGLHDDLFQFSGLPEMPFTLRQTNDFYHQIARAHGHPLDDTYALVLDICSARSWGRIDTGLTCTVSYEDSPTAAAVASVS